MAKLLLRFVVDLIPYEDWGMPESYGPRFHRWLPNGQDDAISLYTGRSTARLKVWFERFGYVDENFIRFDPKRKEIEPEILERQGNVNGGPLIGQLEVNRISEEQLVAVRSDDIGSPQYVALGKRMVRILYSSVAQLITLLRTNYGQYWIRELEEWDSRKLSLGAYCHRLNLKWSLDGGESWSPFEPDKRIASLIVRMSDPKGFKDYLTRQDWEEIATLVQTKHEVSAAGSLLSQAHRYLDGGDTSRALIEGVTALELAIGEHLRRDGYRTDLIEKSVRAFWNLSLRAQLAAVASAYKKADIRDVELALEAIEMRNKVIHEGWKPLGGATREAEGLLRTVAALVPGPTFRFPGQDAGNVVQPVEKWEEDEEHRS